MMTEDEAKTKWCPMSRVLSHTSAQDGNGRSYEGGYSWNRAPNTFDPYRIDDPPYTPGAANCVGSACMMWRGEGPMEELYTLEGDFSPADAGFQNTGRYTANHRLIWERSRKERKGYCGLAGVTVESTSRLTALAAALAIVAHVTPPCPTGTISMRKDETRK